jgi:hypothetical protein
VAKAKAGEFAFDHADLLDKLLVWMRERRMLIE